MGFERLRQTTPDSRFIFASMFICFIVGEGELYVYGELFSDRTHFCTSYLAMLVVKLRFGA